jgi:PPOX class probable F420-dependent enzyme
MCGAVSGRRGSATTSPDVLGGPKLTWTATAARPRGTSPTMPKPPLPAELSEFLARPNPAVIGTVTASGDPRTVATWYLWEDGRVLMNLEDGRARLDDIRRDPRASLTVLGEDSWYRHVTLHGRIATLEDDSDFAGIDRLSRHYMGQPYSNRERGRVNAWLEVESWHAWDQGKPWTPS